ncbi:MAG: type 2 isopentenyl-diphosphate Delta-isomerase [Peptococcia bacterium]
MDERRIKRKYEHLQYALQTERGPLSSGWEDLHFVHQALLKDNLNGVDTSVSLFHKKLNLPIIINAMTGGAKNLEKVNRVFAEIACEYGLGMAVGSQTAALNNKAYLSSYQVVRDVNPAGLIFANVSAGVKPEMAQAAVEMIEADALQLHLNGVQELVMKEGDRQFSNWTKNIAEICQLVSVPVIAKEVGNGISWEIAEKLSQLGVKGLDTGGSGGTNFASIELARYQRENLNFLRSWGIPSAVSLLEVCSLDLELVIIASGGITNSLEVMKALAVGADVVGIAGFFLQKLINEGEEALRKTIHNFSEELKTIMLLTGTQNLAEIKKTPLMITGFVREWCEQRNLNLKKLRLKK